MLKTPIILLIVPSRYWLLVQCGMLIGIATLSYWVGDTLTSVAMVLLGGVLIWRGYCRQSKGVLSLSSTASLCHGRWVMPESQPSAKNSRVLSEPPDSEQQDNEQQVRCDYLGPWLIGLYVGKQRVWLWPDSAPTESLRQVRKLFQRPGR